MAKQVKNNFELKKGKRFQFDLSKNPKRTFDLVKDEDEATVASKALQHTIDPATNSTETTTDDRTPESPFTTPSTKEKTNDESKNNGHVDNNKWMWIVGAILIVAIIAWLCVRSCSSSNNNGSTTEPSVEAVGATEASEEVAAVEESSNEDEAEQVASSETGTESPALEEAVPSEAPTSTAIPSEISASVATATQTSAPISATRETVSNLSDNTVSATPAEQVSSDIESEAMKVIRGDYGVGLERKLKLGSKYQEIQNRVNELKRQGTF